MAFTPGFYPVPKLLTRHVARQQKDAAEDAELKACYVLVNDRDGNRCRPCGHCVSQNGGLLWRREHNHLHRRATVAQAMKHTTGNVHLTCARCHTLITNDKIRIIGQDCNGLLAFVWSPHATPGERKGITLRDERVATV